MKFYVNKVTTIIATVILANLSTTRVTSPSAMSLTKTRKLFEYLPTSAKLKKRFVNVNVKLNFNDRSEFTTSTSEL